MSDEEAKARYREAAKQEEKKIRVNGKSSMFSKAHRHIQIVLVA